MASAVVGNGTLVSARPKPMQITSHGVWQGESPLDSALPLLILQICIVVALTRLLSILLKPLRQPRVIAEIIGGILLGPSALGRNKAYLSMIFPERSLTVLDTVSNVGLLFFLFLVGLELDLRSLHRTGKRAFLIALAGISLPFVMGIGTSLVLRATISQGSPPAPFLVFMGVSLSITAFPVLARILAELKLLTTDVGRIAMSAAAVNDVAAWILLALAIALSGKGSPLISLWVLLTGVGFVVAAFFLLVPVLKWMTRRSPEGEPVKEVYICSTLIAVLVCSFLTDAIGIHALFGAFVVGVMVPKEGPFAGVLIEKTEDLISGLILPLYFVSSGLKTNVATINGGKSWALLILVIATTCIGKIGGTLLVSLLVKMPPKEGLALGLLMNTKGLVELIVLNIGKDRKVLNDETFAIMVLMALFTTFITSPLVMAVYKPARLAAPYKHRSIQRKDKESELRIVICFHGNRNIPTLINLVESSRGIRKRGLTVYAMHLMELSERSSAISMVHKARNNGLPFWNKLPIGQDSGDQVVVAFQAYQQLSQVSIRPMTAISDLHTIHEDVVTSAHQKRAALILLPFHKLQQLDGSLESIGNAYQHVNQRVLRYATCSVGILVDRGLGGTTQVSASDVSYTIAVLFFGGPDDREALAYGARMAEHPGIVLKVLRFTAQPGISSLLGCQGGASEGSVSIKMEANELSLDLASINELKNQVPAATSQSIEYQEKVVGSKQDITAGISTLSRCNLFLVGRSPRIAPLMGRVEFPELGPVGSYLASSDFSTTASVLVMKNYDPMVDASPVVQEAFDLEQVPDTPMCSAAVQPNP
ncbi:Cation/H+ exchanger domain-containing protein [Dioscorea alata]|uniref:Cation/H+ exchanger domain-containing protein n=1 Tax=Dioscorea alata TaxID=55571 RepID=A0ACB7VPA3_DIOAL|nr:Cation/H+ exchanger domain-containing protein [Dioscorea alata]